MATRHMPIAPAMKHRDEDQVDALGQFAVDDLSR
jgi:hypothetical protein